MIVPEEDLPSCFIPSVETVDLYLSLEMKIGRFRNREYFETTVALKTAVTPYVPKD